MDYAEFIKSLNHSVAIVKFENDEIKKGFKNADDTYPEIVIKAHTVHLKMDYRDCTADDIIGFLKSTTTPNKMYQNNVLKDMTEEEIVEHCRKTHLVNVKKDLLDNRKTRSTDPKAALSKNVTKMQEKGFSKEETLAALKEQIELLEKR